MIEIKIKLARNAIAHTMVPFVSTYFYILFYLIFSSSTIFSLSPFYITDSFSKYSKENLFDLNDVVNVEK